MVTFAWIKFEQLCTTRTVNKGFQESILHESVFANREIAKLNSHKVVLTFVSCTKRLVFQVVVSQELRLLLQSLILNKYKKICHKYQNNTNMFPRSPCYNVFDTSSFSLCTVLKGRGTGNKRPGTTLWLSTYNYNKAFSLTLRFYQGVKKICQ